jgi:hypothetical protein
MNTFHRAYGFSVRCIKDASGIPPSVGALNCGSTAVTGTLANGIAASAVSAVVPYTGGNGGSYASQSISSTDVTGLTGIVEPIDVTSSEHFVYADVINLAGKTSQLSFAYAPNLDAGSVNGSDRIVTLTNNNFSFNSVIKGIIYLEGDVKTV